MTLSDNGNPFPGLSSFERERAYLFFGRDQQIEELITRLKKHRFLPIVGVSGSGKSSLVRAGLIPALTESYVETETSGWRVAILRPGRDPMNELTATLCREFALEEANDVLRTLRSSSAGLALLAQEHLRGEEKLLVLVDQFEELFRYREETDGVGEADDDAFFVKLLLAAAGESEHPLPGFHDLRVYVVTTMRSDFLGMCSRFRGLPEALNHSQYLIPRLTREQQRDVIEGPVAIAGASIEPALVQRLLNDLGDNPDQLPALQHALMRTWEQSATARAKREPIAVSDYEAVGGMADALNRDANRVYDGLSTPDAQAIARRIFQRLVRPAAGENETRSPATLSELVAVTATDEGAVKSVLDTFQERGFLTVSSDEDPIIDITHESLIRGWENLRTWVHEELRSAAIYRRLADAAALYSINEGALLVNPQLQLTLNWRDDTKPNAAWAARYDPRFEEAMEFLEQSHTAHQDKLNKDEQLRRQELKRTRLIAIVLGTLLLLAVSLSVLAGIQWKKASEERKNADAERRKALAERDRSSRLLYDSNIYLAASAMASGQYPLARTRLDEILDADLRELRGFEWFYLWRECHANETNLTGHSDIVWAVAFSRDGKMLASSGADKKIKLWDTARREELATFSGHLDLVRMVAFSPNGKNLVSGSDDGQVKVWDIATHKEVKTLPRHTGTIWSLEFSPDGRTLAAADDDGVKLWNTSTWQMRDQLARDLGSVLSIAFSADGKTLAATQGDNSVGLWDIATLEQSATFPGHFKSPNSVAFSRDARILAVGDGTTVTLWDTAALKKVATLSGHTDVINWLTFSPDNKILASASQDGTIKLWDVAMHREVTTLAASQSGALVTAFSPDGKTLASAGDKTVKLWDMEARKKFTTLSGHSGAVSSVAFSPDGKTLASAGDDSVKLWDTGASKELTSLTNHVGFVSSVAFSSDGKTLASAGADKTVKLWDAAAHKEVSSLTGHSGAVLSVAFSSDGKILASASEDHTVKLWDVAAHKELATLLGHSGSVSAVAFSPDGKILASAGADATVKLWDTAGYKELATLSGHTGPVLSVAFSPDGKTLASAGADGTVKLWDHATRKQLTTLSGHSASVLSVVFSPDGKTLASASDDQTVRLWSAVTYKELIALTGNSGRVVAIAFSPDGKTLASACGDKTIKLRFAATEEEVEAQRRPGD